ncbi:winged helix-turn-helix domain-containing protein [Paenibacillus sp. 453mf]|uniref:winged helix-turn-helix domain-containing protein n=1 Tax=Paenibacillus sp. 453mf TaxID=1761874 RepID=UPI0008EB09A7|nr:winged helix-turn-helix domain-containing protein [Paenibacillus sp. 453mf]SFS78240.1 Transcriptional regulatory protein, C terminal [Paenibacillus sp. 453mf]
MAHIYFHEGDYTVSGPGGKAALLSKEFALLYFLYRNQGKTFTREHLLDQVWPLEYPGERTVDDHIYRLRKKLSFIPEIKIHTVRGLGYRLTAAQHSLNALNPSMADSELQSAVYSLFQKYHLFGQGKSITTLIAQQEALGIKVAPFYENYLHFLGGDLSWFMSRDDLKAEDRLYWLLILYGVIASPQEGLQLCQKALLHSRLEPAYHREMYYLNIIDLYAENGMYSEAEERITASYRLLDEQDDLESFRIPLMLSELLLYIHEADCARVENSIQEISRSLKHKPYLREICRFHYMQGMWHYRQGRIREASAAVDDALEIYSQSGFVPHILLSVRQFLYYMELHPPVQADKAVTGLTSKLLSIFQDLDNQHHYTSRKEACFYLIQSLLSSV